MKRQRDKFPWPLFEEEFDVAEYFTKLEQHKFRFLAFIFIAVAASFVFFKYIYTTPTESQLVVDIGFPSIKRGRYPDGSIFDKNDIVADSVLGAVYKNIPALADGRRWSRDGFNNFFLVEGVYPMDIMLAKQALAAGGGRSEETIANYEKVRNYIPKQYTISFRPIPLMPEAIKSKVFEELVRQYKTEVLNNHFLVTPLKEDTYNENASITANYEGLNKRVRRLNNLVMQTAGRTGERADFYGNSQERLEAAPRWQGADEFSAVLTDLNADISILDTMMLDEKVVPSVDTYRRQLESEIANINFEIKRIEKQADFRLRLAELTKGTPKDSQIISHADTAETASGSASAQKQEGHLLNMLLSYAPKYYSMIDETQVMFDKKVDLEHQRDIVQYRLGRLNAPVAKADVAKLTPQDEMVAKLKKTFASLSLLERNFAEAYRKGMAEYESPVSRYVMMHQAYSFPYKKAALWAAFMAVALCGVQALVIYVRQVVTRQTEEKLVQVNVQKQVR